MTKLRNLTILIVLISTLFLIASAYAQDDETRNVLKQGLLGAATGAVASGASGGKAGQGALIGAGTSIIGGALLDAITTPSPARRAAPPPPQGYYGDQQDEYYEEPAPQQSGTNKILKQGLVGAGSGALASGMSGGNAGQGALIGAGTSVIGGALLDAITAPPPAPRRVYRKPAPPPPPVQQQVQQQQTQTQVETVDASDTSLPPGTHKKITRKYDENGKVVSEEETYY